MILGTHIPTPVEEMPEKDREKYIMQLVNEYIIQGYGEEGISQDIPLEANNVRSRMDRIRFCRAIWNNDLDEKRYDYLYHKVEKQIKDPQSGMQQDITLELPAKVRHIPIVRPKLESLISKELNRPLIKRVIGTSEDIVDKKLEKAKDSILKKSLEKINERRKTAMQMQQMLQVQQQVIQQAAQIPQSEQLVMQMQMELEEMQTLLSKELMINKEEYNEIIEYYMYDHKEFVENLCFQALEEYYDRKRLRQEDNDNFEEQMISGEPIWFVDWQPGMDEPEHRIVRPDYVWYDYNNSAKYLHELPWLVEYMPLSYSMVVHKFGHKLTDKDLERIRNMHAHYSQKMAMNTNLDTFPNGMPSGDTYRENHFYNQDVDVYRVTWKEQVAVYALYKENDKPSMLYNTTPPFVRFLTKEEAKEMTSTEKRRKKLKRNGEVIKKRYRNDRYTAYRIGNGRDAIYIDMGKERFQYRLEGNLSSVPLPYVGFANNRYHKANSPIWETHDLQDLYNILHYQEELLIALSGVKGMIYDLSQMPSGMSPQEIIYYRKQGLGLIETMHKNGRPKDLKFNQFQTYDDTLSPAVGVITQVKESLKIIVADITGVQPQQQGQVSNSDQVGTYKMALQQSNVTVERYYQKHEELIEIRNTMLCNLFPYAYAKGKKGAYVVGKEAQKILNIQKDQLKGEFRNIINNGSKEREIMQHAKEVATQKMASGQLETSAWLDLLDLETLNDMRKMLKNYEQQAREILKNDQMEMQEQQEQIRQQAQQINMQMAAEMEQLKGQIQMQVKQMQAQVELQKKQIEVSQKAQELAVKQELEQQNINNDRYKIDTEADVERDYLNYEYLQLKINDRNQRAQMLINRAQKQLELAKSTSKERIKD